VCQDWPGPLSLRESSVLTHPWQQATILYRLVGATVVNRPGWQINAFGLTYVQIPVECMPIPYTITDFGRVYLAALRATESEAAREWFSRRDNGLRRRRQAARRLRSPRKT